MRTLVVFVTVAVAGMALLPETPVSAGVGKDPAAAYAPVAVAAPAAAAPSSDVKSVTAGSQSHTGPRAGAPETIDFRAGMAGVCFEDGSDGRAERRGCLVVVGSYKS